MAQPSRTMATVPVPVVEQQYCCPYNVDLAIVRKVMTLTDGNFVVTDSTGNLIFKVKGKFLTLHDRCVLIDASGNPIVTLRQKIMTAHIRWEAFRGESSDMRDHIFTAKKSSVIQLKTKLEVFWANNRNEHVCDFKVEGSWFERSCVIHAGESPTNIVARMHQKTSIESVLLGKDKFMVTVYPNIDRLCIYRCTHSDSRQDQWRGLSSVTSNNNYNYKKKLLHTSSSCASDLGIDKDATYICNHCIVDSFPQKYQVVLTSIPPPLH